MTNIIQGNCEDYNARKDALGGWGQNKEAASEMAWLLVGTGLACGGIGGGVAIAAGAWQLQLVSHSILGLVAEPKG